MSKKAEFLLLLLVLGVWALVISNIRMTISLEKLINKADQLGSRLSQVEKAVYNN